MAVHSIVALGLSASVFVSGPIHADTPHECGPRRSLFVVSHGWHTGLVLPRADLAARVGDTIPAGNYVEVGWGDERFYQAGEGSLGLAVQALAWATPAVLHIVSFHSSPQRYFPGSEVIELTVPATGYAELLTVVIDSFTRAGNDDPIRLGRGLYGNSVFFRARGRFHALNTCNTWVARIIAASGYPISVQKTVTVGNLMSQLPDGSPSSSPCFAVRRTSSADGPIPVP